MDEFLFPDFSVVMRVRRAASAQDNKIGVAGIQD